MAVSALAQDRLTVLIRDVQDYMAYVAPFNPVHVVLSKCTSFEKVLRSERDYGFVFSPVYGAINKAEKPVAPQRIEDLHTFLCSQYNDVPYHNVDHAYRVYSALSILINMSSAPFCEGYVNDALVAALAHDAKHPGVPGRDYQNIRDAIDQLPEFAKHFNFDFSNVVGYIKSTEFTGPDFLIECPGPALSKLLRDADLMGFMFGNWDTQLAGLACELNWQINTPQDAEELLWQNSEFLASRLIFNPVTAECITHYVLGVGRVLSRQAESKVLLSKLRCLDFMGNMRKYFQL